MLWLYAKQHITNEKDEAAMSASQDKKRRQSERAEGVDKRGLAEREAQQKSRKERRTWTIVVSIVVVLALIIILLNTNLLYTGTTAVTVGDTEYTNAEYQYYYYSELLSFQTNYQGYVSMFFDVNRDLGDQELNTSMLSSVPESLGDGTGATWEDYFAALALENMREVTALYSAAVAAGYTLSDEDAATIEETITSLETAADTYGWRDGDAYASVIYGKGVDLDTVREQMERSSIASAYAQDMFDSFEYTPEQLADYYDQYADVFDTLSFEYYLVSAEQVETTETVTDEETGEETEQTTEAVTDETMAAAEQQAEDILDAFEFEPDSHSEQHHATFTEAIAEVMGDEAGEPYDYTLTQGYYVSTYLNDNIADWVLDSAREPGDTTIIENEGSGYYVVAFYGRSDNDVGTVSFRHILINATDEDEDGEYSDEELAAAESEIQDIYTEWQEGDATEDSFYELQQQYSDDVSSSGVLYGDETGAYTHIIEGSMVDTVDEWIFDSARQPGDTAIVHAETDSYNGYHLLYFICNDDEPYCDYLAEVGVSGTDAEGLRNIDYNNWLDELVSGVTVSVNSFVNWFAKTR